jgi:hypothetical protein
MDFTHEYKNGVRVEVDDHGATIYQGNKILVDASTIARDGKYSTK